MSYTLVHFKLWKTIDLLTGKVKLEEKRNMIHSEK